MTINKPQLDKTYELASEMCSLITAVQMQIMKEEAEWNIYHSDLPKPKVKYFHTAYPSKLTGELRRRSMDLTRALAEMRKP